MTKDAWVSLLVKVLLMVLTPLAAQLHINDGATISAFATDLADIIVLGFGVYQQWNMKRVPQNSVAIAPENIQTVANPKGATAVVTDASGKTVAAKVVGALLAAFVLAALALPDAAQAASKITKAAATSTSNPLSVIQTFTENDLAAALADATTNNDIAAVNCYTALLPIVKSGVANPLPTSLGGFQLLQKARDLKTMLANLQSPNGPLAQLNIACAPLVLDVQNTMVLLGVVGGGVALTGGAGGLALPGLGALIPGL